jgi:hypothetical protein
MTDAHRSDRPSPGRDGFDRERDARIDELILAGLDHYFAGRHELAISVWTRVLFLDRGHAKARAYIERARSALSERQREEEELFHTGAAALNRGDRVAARRLLTSAVERGARGEEALALLHRLDRMEFGGAAADTAVEVSVPDRRTHGGQEDARRDHRVIWVAGGICAGVLIAAVAAGYLWIVTEPFDTSVQTGPSPSAVEEPLPVPSPGELRLYRARALAGSGRLREALLLLDADPADETIRVEMQDLRASIQRRLLEDARKAATESR